MSIFDFLRKPEWPAVPFDEIKKRARLVVIDDCDFPYEILFKRDGYTIERWPDIVDLPKLEVGYYDIILLDLQGVGREYSVEQGLGVLRHLHETSPSQIIIAYSSADFSLRYQDFISQADDVLAKSSDYVDFKRSVDKLLEQRYSVGFYIGRVTSLVGGVFKDTERIEKLVKDSVRHGSSQKAKTFLERQNMDPQIVANVLSVLQTAITLASLWKR